MTTTGMAYAAVNVDGRPSGMQAGRVALWTGARERGETGLIAPEGMCAFALFEVPSLPDFSSPRFPDLSALDEAQRTQRVGQLQQRLLAAIHALGPGFGISIRYVYTPRTGQEGQIRLFVVGRAFGFHAAEAQLNLTLLRETFLRSFPSEYRLIDWQERDPALAESVLQLAGVRSLVEILKVEQTPPAWHDPALCGFSQYYVPLPFTGAEPDMIAFCQALRSEAGHQSVIVDVTLVPTPALTDAERQEMMGWMGLCDKWGRDQKLTLSGGLYSDKRTVEIAADPQAVETKKAYGELLGRYGPSQNRIFLYGVRVLSGEGRDALTVATALAAQALGPGSTPRMRLIPHYDPVFPRAINAVRGCYVSPAVCHEALWTREDAPETLRRLHRMVDLREVAGFFRLPIPGRDGCPGVALDAGLPDTPGSVRAPRAGVVIGRFVAGTRVTQDEAAFLPNDLAKHGLIVGTPGSGKTSLAFSLLTQLWEGHGLPFLVLEPAKTEYRALATLPCFQEDLLVFTVGNERTAPFRFNPFEIQEGVSVAEHISGLNTCFAGAFNLFDPLPMLLDQAIRACYGERGWSEYEVGGETPGLEAPTMGDLYRTALQMAEQSSYKGETMGNIRGALETRLGALLRGPKGRCFNTRRSVPMEMLLSRPVVLELEALNDDEKALLMLFLLTAIRAYARARRKSGTGLQHIVLVEEAHNVIGRDDGKGGGHTANPKEVAIRFFVRMLAEMRALGEGVLIADQLPTAIAPEAIKSTNLKVMHRVVAAEDRQELGQTMAFDGGQFQQAALLPPGHSLVFQEGWAQSRLVQEPDFKSLHPETAIPPDDGEVKARMDPVLGGETLRPVYLPYRTCGSLCSLCTPRVREQTERWMERKRPLVAQERQRRPAADPALVALEEILFDFDARPEEAVRWHCLRVHFQAETSPVGA